MSYYLCLTLLDQVQAEVVWDLTLSVIILRQVCVCVCVLARNKVGFKFHRKWSISFIMPFCAVSVIRPDHQVKFSYLWNVCFFAPQKTNPKVPLTESEWYFTFSPWIYSVMFLIWRQIRKKMSNACCHYQRRMSVCNSV